jgi:integrase
MASIFLKDGVFVARFRHGGREYKRSLKTGVRRDAELALAEIVRVVHRLRVGLMAVPDGVGVPDFVLSGGTLAATSTPVAVAVAVPTLADAADAYLGNLAHLAPSTRLTAAVHLRNLSKELGSVAAARPVDRVTRADLERVLQARLAVRAAETVKKERATAVAFFDWCAVQGFVAASPAAGLTPLKGSGDAPHFQTLAEIEAVAARGGLDPAEERALWDRLYLTPPEVGEVLGLVRGREGVGVTYLLHAVPAYTGMRRGEVLRLRWSDVDLDRGTLVARSRKQSRQAAETARRIDLHADLGAALRDWRGRRPAGQYVVGDDGAAGPLARHRAVERFARPLRGTRWAAPGRPDLLKIGFHTYRHSVASNLAAAGVDQRVIDELMGHTTEAMRKRYRHLAPRARRAAIETLSYGPA